MNRIRILRAYFIMAVAVGAVALGGCAAMSPNQTIVAWSQACHEVALKRVQIGNEAKNGHFTALQKAEIKGWNDQLIGLCTTPPTSANAAAVTAQVTALLTKLAVYAGINSQVKK